MLHYNRVDISEGIYVNETGVSKECTICHYRYFIDKGFKFQSSVCNCCQDVLMISINLEETAILNIYGVNYCCIINRISKKESTNLLENTNLCEKSISLGNINFYYHV